MASVTFFTGIGWLFISDRTQTRTVPKSEASAWVPQLGNGRPIVFQPQAAAKPEPTSAAGESQERIALPLPQEVRSYGRLSAAEKRQAKESLSRFAAGSFERYQLADPRTREGACAALREAVEIEFLEIAAQMVERDEVWVFVRHDDNLQEAWRNVPREWRKSRIGNAARSDDGKILDMIIAVNPADHANLSALMDQSAAAEEESARSIAVSFNALPVERRRDLIGQHDAAEAEIRYGRVAGNRRDGLAAQMINPRLQIDRGTLTVSMR